MSSEPFTFSDPIASPEFAARPPQQLSANDWARRAVAARREGAWDIAAACGRQAMRMAPFNTTYRELFTEILYDRLESLARTRTAHLPDDVRERRLESGGWRLEENINANAPPHRAADLRPRASTLRPPSLVKSIAWSAVGAVLLIGGVGIWRIGFSHDDPKPTRSTQSSKTPSSPTVTLRLAEADRALASADSTRAISLLRDAALEFPKDRAAINDRLAVALEAEAGKNVTRKKYSEASKLLEEAAKLSPLDPDIWQQLGRAQRNHAIATTDSTAKRRLLTSAEKSFQRALDCRSGHPGAMLGLAEVYVAMNDRSKAIEQFNTLVRSAPSSSEAKTAKTSLASLTAKPQPAKDGGRETKTKK